MFLFGFKFPILCDYNVFNRDYSNSAKILETESNKHVKSSVLRTLLKLILLF